MAKNTRTTDADQDLMALVERLKKEGHIEYLEEGKDLAEECWVVWDMGEYAVDHPTEIVVSLYKTPEEAAKAWAKFQVRGSGESES